MGKKRRAWWIVGGLVVAVALSAAIAFFIDYNSTDARIERAVAHIVEEYGFEVVYQLHEPIGLSPATVGTVRYFQRAPMGAKEEAEIVAVLRDACPSCKYERTAYDEDHVPVELTVIDPWMKGHKFSPKDLVGGVGYAGVTYIPDDRGYELPEFEPSASLVLVKMDRPSLWQRIKGLWPW